MTPFPKKRIYGLIGPPRSGKDTVAYFLQETRDFAPMAFADRIKEEFGLDKAAFEAAKIAGNIEELRQKLWDFSAQKRATDPEYFIRLVMEAAVITQQSVVITDIRTEDEFNALFKYSPANTVTRVYAVLPTTSDAFENGLMIGSKLNKDWCFRMFEDGKINRIWNESNGLYAFHKELDKYFFTEDIMDLLDSQDDYHSSNLSTKIWKSMVSKYISHFDVRQR